MTKETGPQDYQFKHAQRISMNSYNGIASGRMQLHDPTADGFMRVADMRRDIVVGQKSQSKIYDYDQLGSIRVAKILEIPRIGRGEGGVLRTHKEDDTWFIEIDDQRLWKEVSDEKGNLEQREDQFIDRFRSEVLNGVRKSLVEEKLFNAGVWSPATKIGVVSLLLSYPTPAIYELSSIVLGTHTLELDVASIAYIITSHAIFNMISWFTAIINEKFDRKLDRPTDWFRISPRYQEPWVKHKFPEFLMPPVPIDRLTRGAVYLKSHGHKLIESV